MRNKLLVKLTAVVTSFTMVAAPSITVFATEPETTTQVAANPTTTVDTDIVITDGHSAVDAFGPNTSITVNGNIEQTGDYEISPGSKTVDPAVNATGDTEVTITGDIIGEKTAIYAKNGATVSVDGSINATGYKETNNIYDEHNNLVNTYTSFGSNGIIGSSDINISVDKTINSWGTSINLSMTDVPGGSITVGDTITSTNGRGIYLGNEMIGGDTLSVTYLTEEQALRALPTITVYEVNASNSAPIAVIVRSSQDTFLDIQDDLETAINYIIKKEEGITFADTSEITLASDTNGYDTIKQGGSFKVNATVNSGYYLDAGKNVQVTDNGDGTYTLLFKNDQLHSKGGIYVRALLIPRPVTDNSSEPEYTVVVQDPAPIVTSSNPIATGAIVVANTTSAADTSSAIAAISGTKPARTVSYNIANVTPAQYKASVIENVAAAPASGAFNIETDRVSCFDRTMIEAIAARPDIDVNVVFTYGGKKLKVTIPAGYNVRSLLDEGGYCGFLRLMALLGATELG